MGNKGQFGCVQPDAEQKGLRANKGKHRSHKTSQSARWPLPSKLANFICKGDHSPSGVTKTWKLWPKFSFTTETINFASHCPMSILLNRKLYEKKEGAHGRTLINIVLLRPLQPRAQEAPVVRGQLPALSKCSFMHFIGVGPVPGTDTSKVPKRGSKCQARCAKGSNQDELPTKVAFWGSQSLQLIEGQSVTNV